MKRLLIAGCALGAALIAQADEQQGLLPNGSFEDSPDGSRPMGWHAFTTPDKVTGEFYLGPDAEGEAAHSGEHALQFYFPVGADLVQCAWMSDPDYVGMPVESGLYRCTFWVKATGLQPGFHLWLSAVGYDAQGTRSEKSQRSEYLNMNNLKNGEWVQSTFYFDVRPQDGITRVAMVAVFKTNPDGAAHPVPADMRILIDDIVVEKDQ